MASSWGVTITDLGERRFLFQFYYEIDLDRFLEGSPWTFNNHLLIYHHLKGGEDPMLVPLFWAYFWVQVHDLMTGLFSEVMAR